MCGSTRFKEEHLREIARLESHGYRVFGLDAYSHADGYNNKLTQDELDDLMELHKFKIMLSDAIFVVNVGGYIGEFTAYEINFAAQMNKEIIYLEDPEGGTTDVWS